VADDLQDGCSIFVASRLATTKHIREYSSILALCQDLTLPVYLYQVHLKSENGVSSTQEVLVGGIDLKEGVICQVQFGEDDKMMILWTNKGTCSS
jgi:hypothetical protein